MAQLRSKVVRPEVLDGRLLRSNDAIYRLNDKCAETHVV